MNIVPPYITTLVHSQVILCEISIVQCSRKTGSWVLCFSVVKCLFTHLSLRLTYQLIEREITSTDRYHFRHSTNNVLLNYAISALRNLKSKFSSVNIFKDPPKVSCRNESVMTGGYWMNILGDNTGTVTVILLTVTSRCDEVWTSNEFPCVHTCTWPRVYTIQTCAKLDSLQNFGTYLVASRRPRSALALWHFAKRLMQYRP